MLPRLGEKAKEQPSSRRADLFPITLLLTFLVRSVPCSFWVQNWIFRDLTTTVSKPHTYCSQCRESWVMGLGEQAGLMYIPPFASCRTFLCFVRNYSDLVPPCYTTRKKQPTCSSKSSFSSRTGKRGKCLCTTPDNVQRRIFSCG